MYNLFQEFKITGNYYIIIRHHNRLIVSAGADVTIRTTRGRMKEIYRQKEERACCSMHYCNG